MTNSKGARVALENRQFLCRLSIERCRTYLSHMQAILHVCDRPVPSLNHDIQENLEQMISILDMELNQNLSNLA